MEYNIVILSESYGIRKGVRPDGTPSVRFFLNLRFYKSVFSFHVLNTILELTERWVEIRINDPSDSPHRAVFIRSCV